MSKFRPKLDPNAPLFIPKSQKPKFDPTHYIPFIPKAQREKESVTVIIPEASAGIQPPPILDEKIPSAPPSPVLIFSYTPTFFAQLKETIPPRDISCAFVMKSSTSLSSKARKGGVHLHITKSAHAYDPLEEKRKIEANKLLAVIKEGRGLLNKLSPSNFKTIAQQISKLVNPKAVALLHLNQQDHDEFLEDFLDFLYTKAIIETIFCPLYADLCLELQKANSTIRTRLIHICQTNFAEAFQDVTTTDSWVATHEEIDEKIREEMKYKKGDKEVSEQKKDIERFYLERRKRTLILGNIQFIARLCLTRPPVLSPNVVFLIADTLIKNGREIHDSNSVEALCILLTIVGKDFYYNSSLRPLLERIMINELPYFSEDREIERRINFLCLDVLDLWNLEWKKETRTSREVEPVEEFKKVERRKPRPSFATRVIPGQTATLSVNSFAGLEEEVEHIREVVGSQGEIDYKVSAKKVVNCIGDSSFEYLDDLINNLSLATVYQKSCFFAALVSLFFDTNPSSSKVDTFASYVLHLFKSSVFPEDVLSIGLKKVIEELEDVAEDFPNVYLVAAKFLSLVQNFGLLSTMQLLSLFSGVDSFVVQRTRDEFVKFVDE
ncbi:hypothetical protein RCL1_000498 [Eukaryota sp. TZLM3-RCL]